MGHRQPAADHRQPRRDDPHQHQGHLPRQRRGRLPLRRDPACHDHRRAGDAPRYLSGRDPEHQGRGRSEARRGRGLRPLLARLQQPHRDHPAPVRRCVLSHRDPQAAHRLRRRARHCDAVGRDAADRPRGLGYRHELPDHRQRPAGRDQLQQPLVRRLRRRPSRALSGAERAEHRLVLRHDGLLPSGPASGAELLR